MAKWADYLISGVWYSTTQSGKRITHVMLHPDNDETIGSGNRKSVAEVVRLLKLGYSIRTMTWGYPNWSNGAEVNYGIRNGEEYIYTIANGKDKDNLENSFPLSKLNF